MRMKFIDLDAQRARIGARIEKAVIEVIDSGAYIGGPVVTRFEKELAAFGQAEHALACANGTDALALILMGWDVGEGHAVFCPSFTFIATAEVVPWVNATPVFVDVDPVTYNMSPESLEAAIAAVKAEGRLKPSVVIAVDLFGQPADYPAIAAICRREGMKLISDAAQGFGCTLDGKHPLHWADATATSFYPAKPLGCYGDGGAVLTDDAALQEVMVSLRNHGAASASDMAKAKFEHEAKYLNVRIGMNSRLDAIQAAILSEKLAIFAEEIELRQGVANRYAEALGDVVTVPRVIEGGISTWAQYTIETDDRDGLAAALREQGIPTAVYYPVPMHRQPAYAAYPAAPGGLPVCEAAAKRVISLPMSPYVSKADQDLVIAAVRSFVSK